MNIIEAVILIFSLYLISVGLQYLLFLIPISQSNINHLIGLSYILSATISYSLGLIYLRTKWPKKVVSSVKYEFNVLKVILSIILLSIGVRMIGIAFSYWNIAIPANDLPAKSYYQIDVQMVYRFFFVLLLAPVLEELIFRYYIFQALKMKYSIYVATVTSSALFSLVHLPNLRNFIPSFILGILSCIVLSKTGKIKYSIILHFLTNLFWVFSIIVSPQIYSAMNEVGIIAICIICTIVGIILGLFGVLIIHKKR